MKLNGHHASAPVQRGLTDHQFERLVLFYSDADGLRRGFQFWMGWMGGAEHGCDCVPVYLGQKQPSAAACEILRNRSRKTLVLFSPPVAEGIVELPCAVVSVLELEAAEERCMVVLIGDATTMIAWSAPTRALLEQLFGLGTFVAYPTNAGASRASSKGYELHGLATDMEVQRANGKGRVPS